MKRITLHRFRCGLAASGLAVAGCVSGAGPDTAAPYAVRRDEGVSCRLLPERVAAIVGGEGIVELRCTTADQLWYATSETGRDRRVVWAVRMERGGRVVEDTTGMVIGAGGEGLVVRGSPSPSPESSPDPD